MAIGGNIKMLGVAMQTTIKTLFEKGYNKAQIARMLNIDRKTVRKILKDMELKGYVQRKPRTSMLEPYKEYVDIQAGKGLTAIRIYQDLRKEFGYGGSYDTVRKYLRTLRKENSAYMVLNSLPGEEAQVDFGYIGTLRVGTSRKKAWVFVMTLSYSRYMYAQIVFDQSVKTFIECHKNAFRFFKGVPGTIKIDNLKAAILETNFYEPTVQKHYAAFANWYDFMIEPCRVYTPTDKGKVESSVKYIKNNCFKGRNFENHEEAKEFLADWLNETANIRIHGTTKKIPRELFLSAEAPKLKSIPKDEYTMSSSCCCTVNTNCHIAYKGNYYSVPYTYIGEQINVIEVNNMLKMFYKDKEIALHCTVSTEKGQYVTDASHYPYKKNITSQEIMSRLGEEMASIGPNASAFFENYLTSSSNRKYDYRSISGILSLRKSYTVEIIDDACRRAVEYGAFSYKTIRNICEKNLISLPAGYCESYINPNGTNVSRALSEYDKLAEMAVKL